MLIGKEAMLPFEGITIVALEQAVAAPFATRQLADLGARVIKIERPGVGDFARDYEEAVRGISAHHVWLNRSKESLTLDLKHPTAAAIIAGRLIRDYPRLIVCGISGYGTSGPYRNKKAYDLLVQCEVGVVAITGTPETPCKTGISVADLAGGMYAYTGILTALYQRERTGMGTVLDVSLFDALGEWMGYPAYYTAYGGRQPGRTGASNAVIAPYGPFQCGDGKTVFLGIQNSREWARFCEIVLEQPQLATDARFDSNPKRLANLDVLHAIIDKRFARLTAEAVIEHLEQAGIANARLNSVQEFWDHPQLQARDRWREVDSEVGTLKALLPPITMRQVEPRMDPIPRLGAHTDLILRSLGYDDEAIRQLRSEGVI